MQAVWFVRRSQIARKLAWWLALIGYDRRDRTLSNQIYLVYAGIFWSGWLLAMFGFMAGPALRFLKLLGVFPLNQAAVGLGVLALATWGLYQLWQSTRCSPFVFSEEDAHLICQSPVPRSPVAVAWLLGDWFEPAALFWIGAFVTSIALVDYRLESQATTADLPAYVAAGLQALLLVALVQFGLTALVWAAGALRLQRDLQPTWQPRAVRLGIAIIGLGLTYSLVGSGIPALGQPFWRVILWPLNFPLQAAFGNASMISGLLVALLWVGLGLAALVRASTNLNLSRAAQETTQKEKIETAHRYGQSELAAHIALTGRLGGGHSPSRLPARSGLWMLSWKDILQSSRSFGLPEGLGWLSLFAIGLGACLIPEPGARGLLLATWAVMAGQRVISRLQSDLGHWGLLRLLPFSSSRLLVAELMLPWMLVVLLGWITLAIAGNSWSVTSLLAAAFLLLFTSASISFASAYDLLRQAKPEMLLNGSTPQSSSAGGLLSILCAALTLGVWFGLDRIKLNGSIPAIALAVLLALFFLRLTGKRLQKLG